MTVLLEGLLLVDKPEGPTSHDVVARVRKLTGQRRVGHTGTLDPMASGLLALVLGRATRLARFLPRSPKVYAGSLRLGLMTSTDDIAGKVVASHDGELPAAERVLEAARHLCGKQMQRPPDVSARKVGGRRLYWLARRGRQVASPPTPVEIIRFDLRPADTAADWTFEAEVSSGTYIRALVRDLGAVLGCGGTLTALRRLSIGPMQLPSALPVPALSALRAEAVSGAVIPIARMPLEPPPIELNDPVAVRGFMSGAAVPAPREPVAAGLCRVLDGSGNLIGVAETSSGSLRPKVVLPPPPRGG